MKIAFVTLGYTPLRTSGFCVIGERLVRLLLDAGHQVTVIAAQRGQFTETHIDSALEIYRIPLGRSNWIGYAYQAAQAVQKLNHKVPFDIVHFWDVHFAYACADPFVASLHQSFHQRLESLQWKFSSSYRAIYYFLAKTLAEKPSLSRAAGLLAVSSTTRDEFIHTYNVPPSHIALTRHGIDTEFFRPVPDTKKLAAHLGLSASEPVLLFAGFVTLRKGLTYLAQMLPLIQPTPRLIILGRWNPKSKKHFLDRLGTMKNRVIDAGYVPDEQMPAFYSLADVYISSSLLEGFGLPLAESLACETPVVATSVGATAEVVGPGGILVPPRDPQAMAQAISKLLNDYPLRQELGKQGRNHITQHFTIQTMLHTTVEAYERFKK